MSYALFDYQQEMKARITAAFVSCMSVMCQMPTGTGKTHLLAAVVKDFLFADKTSAVWIIAHRRELVAQIEGTLERHRLRYGGGEYNGRVRVMSIQWLSRNWDKAEGIAPGLIVVDEAHHSPAQTYTELWARYPNAKKLGMTATPCRLNGQGFTRLFDCLVSAWSIGEFILRGRLSAFDYAVIAPDSHSQRQIDSLRKRGADGDYQTKEMCDVLDRRTNIEHLYQSMEKFAKGKKGIVYAVSISHARHIAEYYSEKGVNAVAIDSKTQPAVRKQYVDDFRQGKIQVMVNVDVFSEGFDCPDVEFIQLARPTLSLAKYLQQTGRGLRRSVGKTVCMMIDNVGLYHAFGLPTRSWDWNAMFEGLLAGKAPATVQRRNNQTPANTHAIQTSAESVIALAHPQSKTEEELELVMTRDQLPAAIEQERYTTFGQLSLAPFEDKTTGLWGLRRGSNIISAAQYNKVLETSGSFAVVRYPNMRLGVVNTDTAEVLMLDKGKSARLLAGNILQIDGRRDNTYYIDLLNRQRYETCPKVINFASIELLEVGDRYHSRTKIPYTSSLGMTTKAIIRREFYLELHEYGIASVCPQVTGNVCGAYSKRCLLEDDNDCVYYLCGRLPDGSIVVMDADGKYYHAEEGKSKQYIACNTPATEEERFDVAVSRLLEKINRDTADRMSKRTKNARNHNANEASAYPYVRNRFNADQHTKAFSIRDKGL